MNKTNEMKYGLLNPSVQVHLHPEIFGEGISSSYPEQLSLPLSEESASSDKPEVPEVQETTHQVPCGSNSIFEADDLTGFERAVYLVINHHSFWHIGESHYLSYKTLAKLLNVKHRSQVIRAVKSLIKKGWLELIGTRKVDGANRYRVVHHKCDPSEVPLDGDRQPKKCAVQMGKGSAMQLLADGVIDWRVMLQSVIQKIYSDWVCGIVKMTVRETMKLARFTAKTVKRNTEKMLEIGLAQRLSDKFRATELQLFPKPYPQRKERKIPYPKQMKCVKGWYYSHNKLWRFHRETFRLQMCEHGGRWRDSSMNELQKINPSIHHDFNDYISEICTIRDSLKEAHSQN